MSDNFSIIVPLLKPKRKSAVRGSYTLRSGVLAFHSGKNIVYIREHFSDRNITPLDLVENTILYEHGVKNSVESKEEPCYNERVNDVL
jgi:hypothetical protein